jgi:hypothetical protein
MSINNPKWCAFVLILAAIVAMSNPSHAQDAANAPAQSPTAWTLDQALDHLKLFPRDAYVQYVALQLARREGRLQEVAEHIISRNPARDRFNERRGQISLYSIFSGSLAVQESLQLDAMAVDAQAGLGPDRSRFPTAGRQGPRPIGSRTPTATPVDAVAVSALEGPTIKSHPWREMLGAKQPEVTGLALKVPADFYFVNFRSVNKLLEAADLTNLWGAHLLNQANKNAQTQLVNERLREQLAVETNPALQPFYDAVIDEAAIVGSDLFVPGGSDVTLLFHAKQPAVLRAQMDQFLEHAAASRDDAERTTGAYNGVDWVHIATPDQRIHVYSAYPADDLHVRSNSKAALERVLEAIAGRDAGGEPVTRLGETDEFRYVRTLMPQGDDAEDGFIYLSDPFVRRLMGPTIRLTERRRMVCYNHLRMIGHAGLLYRTQTGKPAESLADLHEADCAPEVFGEGRFTCPEHGQYTLGADGLTGVCSHHGYASYLTPCLEIPTTHVSDAEAAAYRQFLTEYNSYWRQFFDPIAIRLTITPERYRAETIVLPLIDNSIYTGLARALGGGEPEALDELPVPKRNIFTFAVRLNKQEMLREWGMEHLMETAEPEALANHQALQSASNALKQVGLAMHNYHSARLKFPAVATRDRNGRPLLSWRVQLLPYLDQQELYNKFRQNEPWDSPHNRALIAEMPSVFRPTDAALAKEGKTRIVAPRGEGTVFRPRGDGVRIADITDGTSMTIMLVEADDLHATVWTRPDDWEVDLKQPTLGLHTRPPGAILAARCDGSVMFLRTETPADQIAAMFTRAGGEEVRWEQLQMASLPDDYRRGPFGIDEQMFVELGVGEMVTRGIGNQVGFHAYDTDPMFDVSLAQVLGSSVGTMRGGNFNDDFLFLAPLLGSLNGPVYVSIPVKDREIVDGFLDRLDKRMVELSQQEDAGWFFSVDQDFYRLPANGEHEVRGYGFSLGPIKWRFFWSRIGDGLYIASRREVIEDLAALGSAPGGEEAVEQDTVAHGLVRLRPDNWSQVLDAYHLAWEENTREACLRNTGPLSSLSRALAAGEASGGSSVTADQLAEFAARLYDVHHFCPDGGEYHVDADGRTVACSIHHTTADPHQTAAPPESSPLARAMASLRDVRISLTFLEDGLHATATLERKPDAK